MCTCLDGVWSMNLLVLVLVLVLLLLLALVLPVELLMGVLVLLLVLQVRIPRTKGRRIDDDEDDEEEEKADTDSIAVELLSPVPPELFTPPAIRRDNLVSIPFPERMNGVSEATYAMQTKYLAMSREILEKVNAVSLDQTARNELFLMKFCLDNGLGRDPGQQLLNWMKSVCNMHIYMNNCVIFT